MAGLTTLLVLVGAQSFLAGTAAAEDLLGFTQIGRYTFLVRINSDNPLLPSHIQLVSGLQGNEQLIDLDLRPGNGKVYALASTPGTSQSRSSLYTVNIDNGQLTPVVDPIQPDLKKDSNNNTQFGMDFSPVSENLRIVSTQDDNIVINPDTGTQSQGLKLFYPPLDPNQGKNPNVTALAYDNNRAGVLDADAYGIDSSLSILNELAGDTGVLTTVGSLGVTVSKTGGFDVSSSGKAFALLTTTNGLPLQRLYTVNLNNGAATSVGFAALGILNLNGLTALTQSSNGTASTGRTPRR